MKKLLLTISCLGLLTACEEASQPVPVMTQEPGQPFTLEVVTCSGNDCKITTTQGFNELKICELVAQSVNNKGTDEFGDYRQAKCLITQK